MRKTKIIATLGPATEDPKTLTKLLQRVDVVRINLAHGTWDPKDEASHQKKIRLVRKISKKIKKPIAILVDLKGNKIRIGNFKNDAIELKKNSLVTIRFTEEEISKNDKEIVVDADYVFDNVEAKDIILLDDGLINLEVKKVQPKKKVLICIVHEGGLLSRGKGLEVKNKIINQSGLNEGDKKDLIKLAKLDIDWVALSFVNQASDVNQAREVLSGFNNHTKLIAKIERIAAIKQLYWIIKASDGIMVARGDLALECGPGELTGLQKNIIKQTVKGKKIVITATQMMESMIHNPTPTRAEMTDVSNAVLDGTDAVMLSAETAIGDYPIETVDAMSEVCSGAELYEESISKADTFRFSELQQIDEAIAVSSISIARNMNVKAIVALTESGSTALMMSRIRTDIPIYAFTRNEYTQRRVGLYRGVMSYPYKFKATNFSEVLSEVSKELIDSEMVKLGDLVIITSGSPLKIEGYTNSLRIVAIK
ncbi:MAG: pyruvate kinase [Gammaproteobacteria bacterium]|nr:pyruvate kinase [Gammaproteobacteria bacterium]